MAQEFDYYVRTVSGEFRDDRHHFTTKWTGVITGELSSVHFDNPKLEIVTAEQHRKGRRAEPEGQPETEGS